MRNATSTSWPNHEPNHTVAELVAAVGVPWLVQVKDGNSGGGVVLRRVGAVQENECSVNVSHNSNYRIICVRGCVCLGVRRAECDGLCREAVRSPPNPHALEQGV